MLHPFVYKRMEQRIHLSLSVSFLIRTALLMKKILEILSEKTEREFEKFEKVRNFNQQYQTTVITI